MYSTSSNTERKLTAYRIAPLTIERLKTKAKRENVSVNTIVDAALADYVKDVKSDYELEQARKATESFIEEFAGTWSGSEYDGVEEKIFSTRTSRKPLEL